jgi:hypothetical protein
LCNGLAGLAGGGGREHSLKHPAATSGEDEERRTRGAQPSNCRTADTFAPSVVRRRWIGQQTISNCRDDDESSSRAPKHVAESLL